MAIERFVRLLPVACLAYLVGLTGCLDQADEYSYESYPDEPEFTGSFGMEKKGSRGTIHFDSATEARISNKQTYVRLENDGANPKNTCALIIDLPWGPDERAGGKAHTLKDGHMTIVGSCENSEGVIWPTGSIQGRMQVDSRTIKEGGKVTFFVQPKYGTELTLNDSLTIYGSGYVKFTDSRKMITPKSCLQGSWSRSICGGTESARIVFQSDGNGYFRDNACNMDCPRYFPFSYKDNGSTVSLTYKQGTICGEPATPTGGTQAYTCSGDNLFLGNSYTRE